MKLNELAQVSTVKEPRGIISQRGETTWEVEEVDWHAVRSAMFNGKYRIKPCMETGLPPLIEVTTP